VAADGSGVLVIYTGGTIGSKPNQPGDPESPQVVVPWEELRAGMPEVDRIGFPVDCMSLPTPLDSCNVGPAEWKFMAKAVADNYDDYAGFVILHGTDTMVYTAAILSFMLRNLGKPVVITGAQRSALVDVRNDASQNFIAALRIAQHAKEAIPLVPEVCICFGTALYRGNRTVKRDTSGYNAYDSPNLEALGEVGDRIIINPRLVKPAPDQPFQPRLTLDTNVLPIFISPGIQDTEMVARQLATPGLRAVVVMAFGSGNIPTREDFLDLFRKAHESGVLLADVSQCPRGPVELGVYETSAALLEAGFVAASDLSYEAAICKLMALLGQPDVELPDVEVAYQQALAGEQSESLHLTRFGRDSGGKATSSLDGRVRLKAVQVEGQWSPARVERALLRLRGACFEGVTASPTSPEVGATPGSLRLKGPESPTATSMPVDLRVFVNLDPNGVPNEKSPNFAGHFHRYPTGSDTMLLVLDIAPAVRASVRPGERISITVFVDTPGASLRWEQTELAVFVRETDL
jgi:L-asparaginase